MAPCSSEVEENTTSSRFGVRLSRFKSSSIYAQIESRSRNMAVYCSPRVKTSYDSGYDGEDVLGASGMSLGASMSSSLTVSKPLVSPGSAGLGSFLVEAPSRFLRMAFLSAVTLRFLAFSTICRTISLFSFLSSTTILRGFVRTLKLSPAANFVSTGLGGSFLKVF